MKSFRKSIQRWSTSRLYGSFILADAQHVDKYTCNRSDGSSELHRLPNSRCKLLNKDAHLTETITCTWWPIWVPLIIAELPKLPTEVFVVHGWLELGSSGLHAEYKAIFPHGHLFLIISEIFCLYSLFPWYKDDFDFSHRKQVYIIQYLKQAYYL